jgi:hypothetical protein
MMIGAALRAHLLDDVSIAAMVATRCYPLRLPQKTVLPALVLTRISGWRDAHLRGVGGIAQPRYQLDSWAVTDDEATVLGTTIRVTILMEPEGDRDLFNEDISGGLCRHSADYLIWYSTVGGTV